MRLPAKNSGWRTVSVRAAIYRTARVRIKIEGD
jgi:hypothetical protein